MVLFGLMTKKDGVYYFRQRVFNRNRRSYHPQFMAACDWLWREKFLTWLPFVSRDIPAGMNRHKFRTTLNFVLANLYYVHLLNPNAYLVGYRVFCNILKRCIHVFHR